MSSVVIGGIVFCCLAGAVLIGMMLRSRLPEHHLSVDSKDAIKLATAIVVTLSAIALGFLTASAKTAFDQAEAELRGSAAEIVLLDRVLAHYGPETQAARGLLRDFIMSRLDGPSAQSTTDEFEVEAVQDQIRSLMPGTAPQRFLQARALEVSGKIAESHWLFVETGSESPPLAFLTILVFWLTLLFAIFGLLAPTNPTVICTLIASALAVSGAVFLLVDMAHPHLGIIQASDVPLRTALEHMGRP
jgi:hypothetical protein